LVILIAEAEIHSAFPVTSEVGEHKATLKIAAHRRIIGTKEREAQ
jgi:hypothetical protein